MPTPHTPSATPSHDTHWPTSLQELSAPPSPSLKDRLTAHPEYLARLEQLNGEAAALLTQRLTELDALARRCGVALNTLWPASAAQLSDATRTPDRFEPIVDPKHTDTGLDLTGVEGARILDLSTRAATLLDERARILAWADTLPSTQPAASAHHPAGLDQPASAAAATPTPPRPARTQSTWSGLQVFILIVGVALFAIATLAFLTTQARLLPGWLNITIVGLISLGLLTGSWLLHRKDLRASSHGLAWLGFLLATADLIYATVISPEQWQGASRTLVFGLGLLAIALIAWGHTRVTRIAAGEAFSAVALPIAVAMVTGGFIDLNGAQFTGGQTTLLSTTLAALVGVPYPLITHRAARILLLATAGLGAALATLTNLVTLATRPEQDLTYALAAVLLIVLAICIFVPTLRHRAPSGADSLVLAGSMPLLTANLLATVITPAFTSNALLVTHLISPSTAALCALPLAAGLRVATRGTTYRRPLRVGFGASLTMTVVVVVSSALALIPGLIATAVITDSSSHTRPVFDPVNGTLTAYAYTIGFLALTTLVGVGVSYLWRWRLLWIPAWLGAITLLAALTVPNYGYGPAVWTLFALGYLALAAVFRVLLLHRARPSLQALASGVLMLGVAITIWRAQSTTGYDTVGLSLLVLLLATIALVGLVVGTHPSLHASRVERVTLVTVSAVVFTVEFLRLFTIQGGAGGWWATLLTVALAALPVLWDLSAYPTGWARGFLRWYPAALVIVAFLVNVSTKSVTPVELPTVILAASLVSTSAIAMHRNPAQRSWPGLGLSLMLLLLPSLVLSFGTFDAWRSVLLGVLALATLITGFWLRWQSPVIIGGTVLVIHALVQANPLLRPLADTPWWIWLAVGGIVLILIATFHERNLKALKAAGRTIRTLR